MKKRSDVKTMLKEACVLFCITLIAGLMLGFIYELTKEPIQIQKEKKVQQACAAVFKEADDFQEIDYTIDQEQLNQLEQDGVSIGTIYKAVNAEGVLLGYVLQSTSSKGYGGNIVLYLGITIEGKVNDISLLEIKETPGLGMQAEKVLVPQFHNKNATTFTYTKSGSRSENEIDAISGATITTKAVTNAVNGGIKVVESLMQGGGVNE